MNARLVVSAVFPLRHRGDPFQNNGWQFGVPAPQQPSSTDTSNWQFGAPNPPALAAPAAPSAQPFVQPVQAPTMPPAPSAAAAPTATPAPNPNQPNV